jgi:hypothetical protein
MNPAPSNYATIKVIEFNELSKKACLLAERKVR